MATPTAPQGKTERIRTMFNGIALRYDVVNKLMTLGIDRIWRKTTVRKVASHSPKKILDVAVGTADLSIELRRQCPEVEQIIGIDISEGMLKKGEEKVARSGADGIKLEVANCEALPYETEMFDTVMCAFGVRNFEHLTQGLSEMYRVTRPQGLIAVLELSVPQHPLLRLGYNIWTHTFIPFVGFLVARDRTAYNYLPQSIRKVPQYEQFTILLEMVGYRNVGYKKLSGGIATLYYAEK